MIVASVSWGNDSIALVQWLHEARGTILARESEIMCVHADTGWASKGWPARVEAGEKLARSYGFETHRVARAEGGFVELARLRKGFPSNGMQFCTSELKIVPMAMHLDTIDPEKEATVVVGIRREESSRRATWPEWAAGDAKNGGRDMWAPLVRLLTPERDALIERAGFPVLPHRSKECFPCVNANRADLRLLDEERIAELEALEASMGITSKGKPRTLFRPHRFGGAVGIREMMRWAWSERGQYDPAEGPGAGCDSGFCGD